MFGITTSVITRWTSSTESSITCSASSPSAASRQAYPLWTSMTQTILRIGSESSTTRIVCGIEPSACGMLDSGNSLQQTDFQKGRRLPRLAGNWYDEEFRQVRGVFFYYG